MSFSWSLIADDINLFELLPQMSFLFPAALLSSPTQRLMAALLAFRPVVHSAIHGLLPGPQPGSGPLLAEEHRGGFLPVPPESQTKPGQAADPGSAAS